MKFSVLLLASVLLLGNGTAIPAADVFDQHSPYWLKQGTKESKPVKEMSMDAANQLTPLSRTLTSPCIVIKTNDDNITKALVAWGFRKGSDGVIPVLLIERYVTYRGDREGVAAASGKNIMLFGGFSFNFDIGQVVPAGQGGDLQIDAKGNISPVGKAELYGLNGSQLPAPSKDETKIDLNTEGVLPTQFTGTWKVNVDGRWQGELVLRVETNGRAAGTYTSTDSKSRYDVTGRIGAQTHNLKLNIALDNATQTVDAFLWTSNKLTMAGTSTLADRKFGFHAERLEAD